MDTFTIIACIVVLCFGIFAGRTTTINMFIAILIASIAFLLGVFISKMAIQLSKKKG